MARGAGSELQLQAARPRFESAEPPQRPRFDGAEQAARQRFESGVSSTSTCSKRAESKMIGSPGGCASPAHLISNIPQLVKLVQKDTRTYTRLFWETLRAVAAQRHGHLEAAFLAHAEEGLLNFEQFVDLCESLGLNINPGTLRTFFESQLDPKRGAWNLWNFNTALWNGRLERLRARAEAANANKRRVEGHVDGFLRSLLLDTGESCRRRSVERFQQKLTTTFCHDFFAEVKRALARRSADAAHAAGAGARKQEPLNIGVDAPLVLRSADAAMTRRCFQAYELDMLLHIAERVDRRRTGAAKLVDLTTTLALMCPESRVEEKSVLLFRIFDDDEDGCMTRQQLLQMYVATTVAGVIARGDQPSYDADVLLGSELSIAKARRLFDYTVDHLGGEDDLVTFPELRAVLQQRPLIMEELMPRTHSIIMWALQPRPPPVAQPLAAQQQAAGEPEARPAKRGSVLQQMRAKEDRARVRIAAGGGQGARQARSKTLTEKYKQSAAARFRLALRGEWDALDAMQMQTSSSQWSPNFGRSGGGSSPTKLPPLLPSGCASPSGGTESPLLSPVSGQRRLGQSQSLPEIRATTGATTKPLISGRQKSKERFPQKQQRHARSRGDTGHDDIEALLTPGASAEELSQAAAAKLAEARAEAAAVLQGAVKVDKDGLVGFHRFRCYSEIRAAAHVRQR
eukprot:TRINITY_DN16295_c0_g6_i1.p1 TRINITY_DN16295_c0_g6~~TRINITY_DN16295_c0_g6_i1.p1  ORF type:complete len:685 (-),score=182.18 TRINITY_DN16295_c0_g6_i1:179-2233(-)